MVGMGGRGLESLNLNSWFPLHSTHAVWSIYHACVYVTKKCTFTKFRWPSFWRVWTGWTYYPIWNGHPRVWTYYFWLWPEPSSFLDVQASDKGHVEDPELLTSLEKEMREATSSLRVEDLLLGSPMGALYVDHLGVFISSWGLHVDFFSPGRYYHI